MIRMLMCSSVMQEVSAGKPFCGWLGLAEGKEGKRVMGKGGMKEG